MMKFLNKLVQPYSWWPLFLCLAVNMISFQGTRLFNKGFYHYDLSLPIDDKIPLIKWWVVVYLGCYIVWIASYWLIAREERKICYNFFASEIIGKLICMAFFTFLPTITERPEIIGEDIFSELIRWVYSADTPDNLFPSLHCFASWIAWRGLLPCKKVPKWYIWVSFVSMLLVFLSVLFTKQHWIIDILGGIVVAEIGVLIAKLTKAYRFFDFKRFRHLP